MESFSSRFLHGEREIFATKSPASGPCSFLLNFPEGSREGDHLRKVLEVGVGLPVPKKGPGMRAEREKMEEAGVRELEGRDSFNQTSYNDFSL